MGFTFRKIIGKKNLRLNLSNSGPTISTGIKGLRVVNNLNGGVRLYAQKSVAGVDLRYIKTISPKKNIKPKKKTCPIKEKFSQKKDCHNCGKSIDVDSKFCEHCGEKL
jgi:hypothetical protein